MNQVMISGRLGKDPQLKEFEGGKVKCEFSVATGMKDQTDWHNVVAWGDTARAIHQHMRKGSGITVIGRISYRNYDTKSGDKATYTEIVVAVWEFPPCPKVSTGTDDPGSRTVSSNGSLF